MVAYGVAFVSVPLVRYLKVQRDNAEIEKRNRRRAQFAFMLKEGGADLQRKLDAARGKATVPTRVSLRENACLVCV